MPQDFRRMPAVHRCIDAIDPDKDIRVRLLGTVIDLDDKKFVLDDGRSRSEILHENMQEISIGKKLMVFCRVFIAENSYKLRSELVQDASLLDSALYEKVFLSQ